MHSFKLSDDPTVKRLRWVMVGAILFSLINTLAGQPASFWHQPATAIRFDGLPIHSQTNPMFDFFLSRHFWYSLCSLGGQTDRDSSTDWMLIGKKLRGR